MNLDYENRVKLSKKLRETGNYFLIAIISLISLLFLPLLGSTVGLEIAFPDTFSGFLVWISSRLAIATVNVLIFYCFIQQAKQNVAEDENYKKALIKLNQLRKEKKIMPRSPSVFMKKQWRNKGVSLFLASLLSTIFLAEAILRFDLAQFLTYLFTLAIGLVFGYLTMKNNEEYWTNEFLIYVEMLADGTIKEEEKKERKPSHFEVLKANGRPVRPVYLDSDDDD